MNQKSRDLRQETAPTVCATVDQFNRVSLAVIATVLQATDSSNVHCAQHRGKTLARWIEVAQVIKSTKQCYTNHVCSVMIASLDNISGGTMGLQPHLILLVFRKIVIEISFVS